MYSIIQEIVPLNVIKLTTLLMSPEVIDTLQYKNPLANSRNLLDNLFKHFFERISQK